MDSSPGTDVVAPLALSQPHSEDLFKSEPQSVEFLHEIEGVGKKRPSDTKGSSKAVAKANVEKPKKKSQYDLTGQVPETPWKETSLIKRRYCLTPPELHKQEKPSPLATQAPEWYRNKMRDKEKEKQKKRTAPTKSPMQKLTLGEKQYLAERNGKVSKD